MFLDSRRVCVRLALEIGECAVVAVGEGGDARGEIRGDTVYVAADRLLDRRDPSIIHDELSDLVLGE